MRKRRLTGGLSVSCLYRPLVLESLQRPGAWLPAAAAEGRGSPVDPVPQKGQAHVDFHIPLGVLNDGWLLCLCNFDKGRVTFF